MKKTPQHRNLYDHALEILSLSRNISNYMIYDLSALQPNGSENPYIYFTGDIVRFSDSLAPEIIKAESEPMQDDRLKYAASVHHHTNRLYKTCERLERAESNGKEFLKLLRLELKKFRRSQHHWMMTL